MVNGAYPLQIHYTTKTQLFVLDQKEQKRHGVFITIHYFTVNDTPNHVTDIRI